MEKYFTKTMCEIDDCEEIRQKVKIKPTHNMVKKNERNRYTGGARPRKTPDIHTTVHRRLRVQLHSVVYTLTFCVYPSEAFTHPAHSNNHASSHSFLFPSFVLIFFRFCFFFFHLFEEETRVREQFVKPLGMIGHLGLNWYLRKLREIIIFFIRDGIFRKIIHCKKVENILHPQISDFAKL